MLWIAKAINKAMITEIGTVTKVMNIVFQKALGPEKEKKVVL